MNILEKIIDIKIRNVVKNTLDESEDHIFTLK